MASQSAQEVPHAVQAACIWEYEAHCLSSACGPVHLRYGDRSWPLTRPLQVPVAPQHKSKVFRFVRPRLTTISRASTKVPCKGDLQGPKRHLHYMQVYTLPKPRTPACQSARGLRHRGSVPPAARQRASAPTRRWRPARSPPCRFVERSSLESGTGARAQPSSVGSLDSHRIPGGEWAGNRSRAYDRQLL